MPVSTMGQTVVAGILLLVMLMLVDTERVFHRRDHSDIEHQSSPQAETVVTPEEAQEYLNRYGWITPVVWEKEVSGGSSRVVIEDQAPREISEVISEDESRESWKDTLSSHPKIISTFTESLKHFQEDNGLPPSGILDEPTKMVMNRPRCGVPDREVEGDAVNGASDLDETEAISNQGDTSITDQTPNAKRGNIPTNATPGAEGAGKNPRRKRSLSRLLGLGGRRQEIPSDRGLGFSFGFSKRMLSWRLIVEGYSMQLTVEQQRSTLATAFRMWSEVIPLQFKEDTTSNNIDIRVGFGTGQHFGCSKAFDGVGQQYAHAWFLGDIHFDDDEHFVGPASENGMSLLKVAVHEIGHALGLTHINHFGSVMHPNYTPEEGHFELDWEDRKTIQQKYGSCEGTFSTIFDLVRRERGEALYRYNTYFFKDSWYWMYENKNNRTRFGDPIPIRVGWRGLPEMNIDAFVHVWTWSKDAQYVFKGTQVWRYDPDKDMAFSEDMQGNRYPQDISEAFPGIRGPLDAAIFDKKDGLIYFFRGNNVTAFSVELHQKVPTFPKSIVDVFPAVDPADHPEGNLDAVYFSYSLQATFFIKGTFFWKMVDDVDRQANSSLPAKGLLLQRKINSCWFDICEVHPSVLRRPTLD